MPSTIVTKFQRPEGVGPLVLHVADDIDDVQRTILPSTAPTSVLDIRQTMTHVLTDGRKVLIQAPDIAIVIEGTVTTAEDWNSL